MTTQRVRTEMLATEAELKRHMASYEYALRSVAAATAAGEHPRHRATCAHTEKLLRHCRDLPSITADGRARPTPSWH